ncbi:MAG: hypothetical protein ACM33T_10165 [Solirubrobacterales bacterium]
MIVTIHAPMQPGTSTPSSDPKAPALVIRDGQVMGTVPLAAVSEMLAGRPAVALEAEEDGEALRIIGPACQHGQSR